MSSGIAERHRIKTKIEKLLSLGMSSAAGTENESASARQKANQIAIQYGFSIVGNRVYDGKPPVQSFTYTHSRRANTFEETWHATALKHNWVYQGKRTDYPHTKELHTYKKGQKMLSIYIRDWNDVEFDIVFLSFDGQPISILVIDTSYHMFLKVVER